MTSLFGLALRSLDANFRQWVAAVAGWLRDARIVPESEVDDLALLILTVMEGGVMQSRSAGNIAPYDASGWRPGA